MDVRVASILTFSVLSILAPSGMSCGSKANMRSSKRVPMTLRGVASAKGSWDIVCDASKIVGVLREEACGGLVGG